MAKEKRYAIGVDIGGTNMPCSLLDESGQMIHTVGKRTLPEQGPEDVVSRISDSIVELSKYFKKHIKNGVILGVGIGVPGALDHKKGEIITSPNLAGWENVPIVRLLEKKIKMPVKMDNDANCAVLGEHWAGAAKGFKNVILITLGTGVGGGIIIEDKIYRGSHGTAGEIGHITIIADGVKCGCGNHGCLEAYASATAAVRMARERLKISDDITAHDIFLKAEAGDASYANILKESGRYLGIGIATLANIFDPDAIIIGGGFFRAEKYLMPSAIDEAYKRSFKSVMDKIRITGAKLGNDAGIIGAANLLF